MYSLSNSLEVLEKNSTGKICTKCGLWKELGEFYTGKGKLGKDSWCKACQAERNKNYSKKENNSRKTEGTKICSKCGLEKDTSEFSSYKRSKDGLHSWCRQCISDQVQAKHNPRKLVGTKVCTKCGIEKEVGEFTTNRRNSDGLCEKCKACYKKYTEKLKGYIVVRTEGTKNCPTCDKEKSVDEFWKSNRYLDGRHYQCIECGREYNNKQAALHKERRSIYKAKYYEENKNGVIADYNEKNKDELRKSRNAAHKKKLATDPNYKLVSDIRRRLSAALKGGWKSGSAVGDLGCSIPIFRFFLEHQFYRHSETGEMMTWENRGRGKGKWQLDHIKELHTLNLGDRGQFLKAVHVSNYQPLWQDDNIKKSNKIRKLRKKEGV